MVSRGRPGRRSRRPAAEAAAGGEDASGASTRGSWPNLFLVGVAKAGTTALATHLSAHPEIFMASVKEPHFFSQPRARRGMEAFVPAITDETEYLALFRGAREPVRGEASTSYFSDPDAPDRIHAVQPRARILIVLRDPVERAFSHYLNAVREGLERRPFAQAVSEELADPAPRRWGADSLYVDQGFYVARVERWRETFRGGVKVMFYERLFADLPTALADVHRFLELTPMPPMEASADVRINPHSVPANPLAARLLASGRARKVARAATTPRFRRRARERLLRAEPKPPIDAETRALLARAYSGESRGLRELLGSTPPW